MVMNVVDVMVVNDVDVMVVNDVDVSGAHMGLAVERYLGAGHAIGWPICTAVVTAQVPLAQDVHFSFKTIEGRPR